MRPSRQSFNSVDAQSGFAWPAPQKTSAASKPTRARKGLRPLRLMLKGFPQSLRTQPKSRKAFVNTCPGYSGVFHPLAFCWMAQPPVELHIVSDSTGETAARLVLALEAQFPEQAFEEVR